MAFGMRRIGVEERRARLGRRHHLAATDRAGSVIEAVADVVALHGTDPASVFLAALVLHTSQLVLRSTVSRSILTT